MKLNAVSILTTIVLGVFAFLGVMVIGNAQDIIRLQEQEKTSKEMLIEIRKDVKLLLLRGR